MPRKKMNEYIRAWDNQDRCWIYFHRIMAGLKLGRWLEPEDQVHHKDGNILNNSMDNLEVLTKSEHMTLHKPRLGTGRKGCSIEKCNRDHHAIGLCKNHYSKEIKLRAVAF